MKIEVLLYIAISVGLAAVSLLTLKKHRGETENIVRRGDKILPQVPLIFYIVAFAGFIACSIFGIGDIRSGAYRELLVCCVFQFVCFWLSMYSARWFMCYNQDSLVYRSAFGKSREYSFSKIHAFFPVIIDAFLCVGGRICLIDAQQDWMELEDAYNKWRAKNGLKVHGGRKPKNGLGKTLRLHRLGLPCFVFYMLLFFGTGVMMAVLAADAFREGSIIWGVAAAIFAASAIAFGVCNVIVLSNPDEHRKLFNKLWKDSIYDKNSKIYK